MEEKTLSRVRKCQNITAVYTIDKNGGTIYKVNGSKTNVVVLRASNHRPMHIYLY